LSGQINFLTFTKILNIMLNNLHTSLLLPAELAEAADKYFRVIVEEKLSDPFVDKVTALLNKGVNQLKESLTAVRVNALIDSVAAADAVRDDSYIGFREVVDAAKRRRNDKVQKAHEVIWPIIKKAGTMLYSEGYTQQSGKLKALFKELDKAKNQSYLAALNADGYYAELKQAEASFQKLYDQRLNEEGKKDYPTLSEAKKATIPYMNILLDAINILEVTAPGTHTALIGKMNAITTEVMSTARARKTRKEGEGETDN